MSAAPRHLSFLSDLGTADGTAGIVRAVLADLAPDLAVHDITHDIDPYDVRSGSLALARAIQYLPSGLVLAAVDASGSRPAVAIEVAGGRGVLLGPDNGLLAAAVSVAGGADRAVVLEPGGPTAVASPGSVLVARDLLAPAAAYLANGGNFEDLGPEISTEILLPGVVPIARPDDEGGLIAEVVWVDRFGNAQLNVGADDLEGWPNTIRMRWADDVRRATVVSGFADLGSGLHLALDSYGMYAVASARNSAAEEHSLRIGTEVRLQPIDDTPEPTPVTSPITLRPRPDRS